MFLKRGKFGGIMIDKSYRRNVTIACLAIFLVLLAIYYIYHQNTQLVAADNSSMFQILIDFLHGNYLMKNWIVNTSSYVFTDTIWCMPGILLGIHVPIIMSFCGALFHAGFVSIMLYLLLIDERKNIKGWICAVSVSFIYLMLFGVVPYCGYTIENPTYLYLNLCGHAGTFLFIAVELLILYKWRESEYKNKIYPVIFTVYGIMGQMSDSMPLMVFFGPLCVYSLYFLVWKGVEKNRKKDIFLIVDSFFIVIVASVLNKMLVWFGGMNILGVGFALYDIHKLPFNIKTAIIKLLILFGYDTKFGISVTPYVVIVCVILFIIMISAAYQIVQAIRSKPDKLGLLLSLSLFANIAGALIIYTGASDVAARYLLAVPFFGTALVIKFILSVSKNNKVFWSVIAFFITISLWYGIYNLMRLTDLPNYNDDGEAVAAYIQEKGGGYGYGSLWIYTAISAYTDFESTIIPIRWDGWGAGFYHHDVLINTEWYDQTDIHYVVVQSDENDPYSVWGIRSDFIKFAGEPDEDKVFGIYEVLYYEQDLSVYSLTNQRGGN